LVFFFIEGVLFGAIWFYRGEGISSELKCLLQHIQLISLINTFLLHFLLRIYHLLAIYLQELNKISSYTIFLKLSIMILIILHLMQMWQRILVESACFNRFESLLTEGAIVAVVVLSQGFWNVVKVYIFGGYQTLIITYKTFVILQMLFEFSKLLIPFFISYCVTQAVSRVYDFIKFFELWRNYSGEHVVILN